LNFRDATEGDIAAIAKLLRDRAAWMQSRDLGPWTPAWFDDESVAVELHEHRYVVLELDSRIVGCYRLQWRDATYWPNDATAAGYLHRLCVASDYAGRGLGRVMLDDFEQRVRQRRVGRARLDCVADNLRLVRYYLASGYAHVDTVHVRPSYASARFEKRLKAFDELS
jgi:GNAT superfamily N-acetyltransferase